MYIVLHYFITHVGQIKVLEETFLRAHFVWQMRSCLGTCACRAQVRPRALAGAHIVPLVCPLPAAAGATLAPLVGWRKHAGGAGKAPSASPCRASPEAPPA